MRRPTLLLAAAVLAGAFSQSALAGTARVAFAGATPAEQGVVRSALAASSFDWSVIPAPVTVHVSPVGSSYSEPGQVYLDTALLRSGRFAWGVVQHEFAHQVDFLLLDDAKRARLNALVGGADWCYGVAGLDHSSYGCERFASTLAWAYWQSGENSMSPGSTRGESGAVSPAQFRAVLTQILGVPTVTAPPTATKAYAPATKAPATKKPKHRP